MINKESTIKNQTGRINRRLAKQGQRLLKTRGGSAKSNLGDYHTIDVFKNAVVETHVDLDALERDLNSADQGPQPIAQIRQAYLGGNRPSPVPSRTKAFR
jgi:hypothetical protein